MVSLPVPNYQRTRRSVAISGGGLISNKDTPVSKTDECCGKSKAVKRTEHHIMRKVRYSQLIKSKNLTKQTSRFENSSI